MQIGFKVDAKQLAQAFDAAPDLIRQQMTLAMKKATRNVAERARREHRFVTRGGRLEGSIDEGMESMDPLVGYVSVGNANAPYAAAIHGGSGLYGPKHARYPITPRFRKALRWTNGGKFVFAKAVMHPGVKADPFLTNAVTAETPAIEKLFATAIENALK